MAPLKCSIVGTGMSLTVFHLPIILALPKLFTLVSVMERSGKETCRKVVEDYVKVVTTYGEVVGDEEVDVVIVSTPNNTHYEYVKKALEHGKHVMCEKPLVPTAAEAVELFELAKSKGKILCVYQNRRLDADFLTLKDLIDSNKLGPIQSLSSHFDRYKPLSMVANKLAWKETPGEHNDAIYNLGSHLIDQAIVLFGKPHKVTCRSWAQRGVEGLDDSFEMSLHYPPQPNSNGPLFVTVSASILSPQKPQLRYVLQGANGSYIKHGLDPQENYLKVGGQSRGDEYGEEIESAWGTIQTVKEEGSDAMTEPTKVPTLKGDYPQIYENFHLAIESNDAGKLLVTPEQAILNIKLIETGLESSRQERTITL